MGYRIVLLAIVFTLSACGTPEKFRSPASPTAHPPASLTVALYPYVPRIDQFRRAIASAWKKVQPNVALTFLPEAQWDGGYAMDPPQNADVYVFDAMFLEYFRRRQWLEPLLSSEVQDADDFVSYALDGVKAGRASPVFLGIPQLGCANLLFYRKSDAALAAARTLTDVGHALSQCTYTSAVPPDRRGLMIDMASATADAALYLDSTHSLDGRYPVSLPWNASQVDPGSIANLHRILDMASFENATAHGLPDYQRAKWFSEGRGRAFVGFTESLSAMSDQARAQVAFKVMPLSDNPGRALFYADVIGVNPAVRERGTRGLAIQLANLMAATSTIVASFEADGDKPPQYLMPVRPSAFRKLGAAYPIYRDMDALIGASDPIMFKVSDRSRAWLATMKKALHDDILSGSSCGCDFPETCSLR